MNNGMHSSVGSFLKKISTKISHTPIKLSKRMLPLKAMLNNIVQVQATIFLIVSSVANRSLLINKF